MPSTVCPASEAPERRIAGGEFRKQERPWPGRELLGKFGTGRAIIGRALTTPSNRNLTARKLRDRPVASPVGYGSVQDATSTVIQQQLSNLEGVRDLCDARSFVEKVPARNVVENAGRDDIKSLKASSAANNAPTEESDAFHATGAAVHRALCTMGGNPVIPAIREGTVSRLAPTGP